MEWGEEIDAEDCGQLCAALDAHGVPSPARGIGWAMALREGLVTGEEIVRAAVLELDWDPDGNP